jgi:hypothetical protein
VRYSFNRIKERVIVCTRKIAGILGGVTVLARL